VANNPFVRVREQADAAGTSRQDLNRLWWERLPMTYADWEAQSRLPNPQEIATRLTGMYLANNPFLKLRFDFEAFAGKRVLEIGSGAGAAACLFASGGARVTAIDITDQAVDLTRQAAEILGLAIDVRRLDAEHMDFADGSFDFVYTWGVVHHSHNTEAIVAEIARVLRPSGRVLCMVYNRDSLRYWLKGLFWLLARGKITQGYGLPSVQRFFTDGYYHRHFGKGEFVRMFAREGMTLERLSITHMAKRMIRIAPRPIDEWLKRRAGWLMVGEFHR
jgi:2-polyprenyl-3-methyl-5-hydroxy-6-metoxy-1,4-benzoquinol methylase